MRPLTVIQLGGPTTVQRDSVFYEAKALLPTVLVPESPVNPQTGRGTYQILGFIDALSNSPAGRGTGVPAIIFLTTSGVRVGFDVRAEAFFNNVGVWQSIACETFGSSGNLRMGRATIKNPEVYVIEVKVPGPIGPGKIGRIFLR